MTVEETLMKFRPSRTRVFISALIVSVLLVLSSASLAQSTNAQGAAGRLQGQIVDPTGAVIPGASITLKNSSGLVVGAKSGGAGEYEFRNLAPGKYTISVTAKGFAPAAQAIEIVAGQEKKADVPLEILVKEEN